jgi:hypothetical protein
VGEGEHDRVDAEQRRTVKVGVAAVDVAAIGHAARRATADATQQRDNIKVSLSDSDAHS